MYGASSAMLEEGERDHDNRLWQCKPQMKDLVVWMVSVTMVERMVVVALEEEI